MRLRVLGVVFTAFILSFAFFGVFYYFEESGVQKVVVVNLPAVDGVRDDQEESLNYSVGTFEPTGFVPSSKLVRYPDYERFGASCYPLYSNLSDSVFFERVQYKRYGKCQMEELSTTEVIENNVRVTCKNNKINTFFLDPHREEVLGWNNLEVKWTKFEKSLELDTKNRQFLFVRCGSKEIYTFVFSKFDSTVSNSAQTKRKLLEKEFNLNSTKPLTIYMLVLESVSRQNFFRTLPQSASFLQNIETEHYSLFDFSLNNVIGTNTKPNMIPVLYGQSYVDVESELAILNPENNTRSQAFIDLQNKYSIWKHLSRLGYVTMYSYDTVWDFITKVTGKYISVDVKFLNFWHASKKIFGYNDFNPTQRCFGAKDGHWFGLDFTKQYLKSYEGHHRFAYLHLSPGHEPNGVIRTLDKDLKDHLSDLLNSYKSNNEDLLLVLMSDHGRGQGRLEFYIENFIETRMPLTVIIGNKDLFQKTGTSEVLEHNTKRLISRYDINMSLKTFAFTPYGKISEEVLNGFRESYPVKGVKSLFFDVVPEARTCLDVGSRSVDCICKDFEVVKGNDDDENFVLEKFVQMTKRVVNKMRSRNRSRRMLDELVWVEAGVFEIRELSEGGSKRYKVKLKDSVEEFWVEGTFATLDRFIETRARDEDINGIQPHEIIKLNGIEFQIQLLRIHTQI